MRPEYLAAVDAARTGWLYWASILLPSAILWIRVLMFPRRRTMALVVFLAAWASAYALGVRHGDDVENAKHANMQTWDERQDWANDAWRVFAVGIRVGLVWIGA